ncbi:sensor domain-containing protein [Catenulispora pinisilvae]|uniref:sensor domain-containing protein n=1 Tax=Catenulispora pinisilvae TaxID=2705253 RepID=UPI0018913A0C|nr:sensor domain-containing protein [Catenulispora pinisilvae]
MHIGIKGISTAVLTAAVLTTAACSSSGLIGASAGGSGGPGSVFGKTSSAPTGAQSGAPSSVATGSSSGAPSSAATGGSGGTLTADQIKQILLTDKDAPGYTYDASADSTTTTDTSGAVTAGGAACQTFVDAQNGLTTKYGTTAEVDRELKKTADGHVIEDSTMAFPAPDKAAAVITDLTAGLANCKSLTMNQSGSTTTMALSPIPQLIKDGQVGYVDSLTISGKTVLMAADVVHVGTGLSLVALIGPMTSDNTILQQMGSTLGHLSDLQVGRLKTAQGIS